MIRRRRVVAVAMFALSLAARAIAQDEGEEIDEEAMAVENDPGAPNVNALPPPVLPTAEPAPAPFGAGVPATPPVAAGGGAAPMPVAPGITPPMPAGTSPGVPGPIGVPGPTASPGMSAGPGMTATPGTTPPPGMAVAPPQPPATMQVTPPAPTSAGSPVGGAAAAQAPAGRDSPKRLGRQFPTPVNPPSPPETPEVHVTIIPPPEPRVTTDRLRGSRGGGPQMGAGGTPQMGGAGQHSGTLGEHAGGDDGVAE